MTKEEQLEELKKRWRTADHKSRKIIEIRAKLLKMSMNTPPKKEEIFVAEVEKIFS